MPIYTALTTLANQADAELLSLKLEEMDPAPTSVGMAEIEGGSGGFEIDAYFLDEPDAVVLLVLAAAYGALSFAVSRLDDRDWVAHVQRELTPVKAGRLFLYGAHDADKAPTNAIRLRIEAAMAFGTGHHGTTKGCLLALDWLDKRGYRPVNIADIGCGTGVLAMAAAALWRAPVVATDIDPVASAAARENARVNRMGGFVFTGTAPGFRHSGTRVRAPFDLVLANILAHPLKRLAPDMRANVAEGGFAILSGLLAGQLNAVEAVYRGQGFRRVVRIPLGEWMTLVLRRERRRGSSLRRCFRGRRFGEIDRKPKNGLRSKKWPPVKGRPV